MLSAEAYKSTRLVISDRQRIFGHVAEIFYVQWLYAMDLSLTFRTNEDFRTAFSSE